MSWYTGNGHKISPGTHLANLTGHRVGQFACKAGHKPNLHNTAIVEV